MLARTRLCNSQAIMTAPYPTRAALLRPARLYAVLVLALLCLWPMGARAQAPAPGVPGVAPAPVPGVAAPGQPARAPLTGLRLGDVAMRIHLPLIDQLSFTQHPFYQITEDPGYANAHAATALFLRTQTRDTDQQSGALLRAIHSLPAFGVEWVMGVDLPFPRGIGWGFDYTPFSQHDTEAASAGVVTPITMDAFYYTGTLRFYFFNPNDPGINYFVGLGLGFIEGKIKATVASSPTPLYIPFSQSPVGSTRFGLETRGDNWGFRYELAVVNADQVKLASNPYPDLNGDGANTTTLDFSGAEVRVTLYYQF